MADLLRQYGDSLVCAASLATFSRIRAALAYSCLFCLSVAMRSRALLTCALDNLLRGCESSLVPREHGAMIYVLRRSILFVLTFKGRLMRR